MKNLWLLLLLVSIRPIHAQLFGGQIKSPRAIISQLNCANAAVSATVYSNVAINGVNVTIPITASSGGTYLSQAYNSTGVTGLTLTSGYGMIPAGSSNLVLMLSGTANTAGNAVFNVAIGGQTCSITVVVASWANQYPANSVFCANGPTAIVDVTNPTTGKTWMDRNLGASQVATSSTDQNAYGELYQWGRRADGHQCRTSATTATLSSVDQPAHGNFILAPNAPNDWRSPQNTNLWQGVTGVNNPCPSGYRVPTSIELENERLAWSTNNNAGAYNSPLKLSVAGSRDVSNGSLGVAVGTLGAYWSNTVNGTLANYLVFGFNPPAYIDQVNRGFGVSIRCIKETVGSVGAINCNGTTQSGNLISGQVASNVTASVPYTGGNAGFYAAQSIASFGVTGLTATLSQGLFANGAGSVTYSITGTPASAGTATFAISLGGQSCSLNLIVYGVQPQYPANTVNCNGIVTIVNDVTNPTTGKIWMDRNLGASQVATSSTDQNAYGDLYQWGRRADGHQCRTSATTATLSSVDQPAHGNFILAPNNPYDWRSPQNTNLWQGVNGVNNPCPSGYRVPTNVEIENERISWTIQSGVGGYNSPLKFPVSGCRLNSGSIVDINYGMSIWTSSINGNDAIGLNADLPGGAASGAYARSKGLTIRCIKETVGSVGTLNCNGATQSGNLISGQSASNVTASVPYTGGNGGFYAAQSIASTGVTGLTATLSQGLFASGNGSVTYTITGTPASAGTASFAITLGGQSCNLALTVTTLAAQYPANSVFCASGATAIEDVTNPTTGKTWMNRNLGASLVAITNNHLAALGDLYQWGRRADGHQCRTSPTTATLSSIDQPAHGNFILAPNAPSDWRSPQNANLWQGVNGVNNPCPSGYRIPTETELDNERLSWGSNNGSSAFQSPLKWTWAGVRFYNNGVLSNTGSEGRYWSSTVGGSYSRMLNFSSNSALMNDYLRSMGCSVRCIKEIAGALGALNCGGSTTTGTLTNGTAANGVSTVISYIGGNAGNYAAQSIVSTGVTGLIATLAAGTLANGNGNVTYTILGTPASSGTASFAITLGGQSCSFTINVSAPAALTTINCAGATTTGTLTSGTAANGVSTSISYTGGNTGTYSAQNVASTGVTGLTATLAAGTLANGNSSVTYTIAGTPASAGTASFAITLGGQSCSFTVNVAAAQPQYLANSVFCAAGATAIVNVTNPTTGKTWMNRNLGASQVATSSTDQNAYGDLYQWGRRADGHQCRTSPTTGTLSSVDQPAHGYFILVTNSPSDWRSPQNNNLWQGVNGVNNPCPSGYRLPTETELNNERLSWGQNNSIGAFASPLKWTLAGARYSTLSDVGTNGTYWSSTVSGGTASGTLFFSSSNATMAVANRACGLTVRCLKN
jgi:uncharacterized protein (TIGR02145 family)